MIRLTAIAFACCVFLLLSFEQQSGPDCPPGQLETAKKAHRAYEDSLASLMAQKALNTALADHCDEGVIECRLLLGQLTWQRGRWTEGMNYFEQALQDAGKLGDRRYSGLLNEAIAILKTEQGLFDQAIAPAHAALEIFESLKLPELAASAKKTIGNIYKRMQNPALAEKNYREALRLISENREAVLTAEIWYNLGDLYYLTNRYDEALEFLQQALPVFERKGLHEKTAMTCNVMAAVFYHRENEDLELSRSYYTRSIEEAGKANRSGLAAQSYLNLSLVDYWVDDYQQALSNAGIAAQYIEQNGSNYEKFHLAQHLADIYDQMDSAQQTTRYLYRVIQLKDSLYNEQVAEANKKYEALERTKEAELARARNNTLIAIIIGLAAFLAGTAAYFMLIRRNRQLQHQKDIEELLAEMEIATTSSRLEGEISERKRIARSLHDTVGSHLAATRWVQEDLIRGFDEKKADKSRLEMVRDMINQGYHNLRKAVYDLEIVNTNWLEELRQLCDKLSKTGSLEVDFEYIGKPAAVDSETGKQVFHIALILIANVLKHARAEKLRVKIQLSDVEQELSLVVEDDGIGFEVAAAGNGHGLQNLRERVREVNGTFQVRSEPMEGTRAVVRIPIYDKVL